MTNFLRSFFTKQRIYALVLYGAAVICVAALCSDITRQKPKLPSSGKQDTSEALSEAEASESTDIMQITGSTATDLTQMYEKNKQKNDNDRLSVSNVSCESEDNIITSVFSTGKDKVLLPNKSRGITLSYISAELEITGTITTLELPGSVTAILSREGHIANTKGAFYMYPGLARVLPSESLSYIGNKAFYACPDLEEFFFPKSLLHIGERAFYDCDKMKSISVYGSTAIDDGAFAQCSSLAEVYLSDKVTRVGLGAFEHTEFFDGLTDEFCIVGDVLVKYNGTAADVVIPDGVRIIADGVFAGKFSVKTLTVPKCVEYIGNSAFRDCFRLESFEFDREQPPVIGEYAFEGCPLINEQEVKGLVVDKRDMLLTKENL